MQISSQPESCSGDYRGCEQCPGPQTRACLVIFFPSNYPWGGFFLTLVLHRRNEQEISLCYKEEKKDLSKQLANTGDDILEKKNKKT